MGVVSQVKNKGCGCLMTLLGVGSLWIMASMLNYCVTRTWRTQPQQLPDPILQQPSKPAISVPETPTGEFTVNLLTRRGSDKRFSFYIKEQNHKNEIKMNVTETGSKSSYLGGMLRFNVVFWNPSKPDKSGLGFQLLFNDEGGCFTLPMDKNLKTVYLTQNERVCVTLQSNGEAGFVNQEPLFSKTRVLKRLEITLPNQPTVIPQSVIQEHLRAGRAIELNYRQNSR